MLLLYSQEAIRESGPLRALRTENVANYDACETLCLSANSTECVAYSFFTNGTCQFLTLCTGRAGTSLGVQEVQLLI